MIGRADKESEADRALYALDADNVRPEFKKLIMEVNDRTIRWPLKYDRQPKAGSDNLVFNIMNKTPGVFFWSGPHADYHRSTDDADKIDYEKAEKISAWATSSPGAGFECRILNQLSEAPFPRSRFWMSS